MLKKTITYEDYDGNSVTEDFYFNLSKAELVELELSEEEGFVESIQAIIKAEDGKRIIEHFKSIILLAYGKKSEDGRRFIKSQKLRDEFTQSPAYSELFIELATNAEAAAAFINGIIPAGLQADIAKAAENLETKELPTEEISDEELLQMSPMKMSKEQLQRAMALKAQQG